MNYIPKDKRERVQSFINECADNIKHVLTSNVIITLTVAPALVDEDLIRQQVCEGFGVTWEQILEKNRTEELVLARQSYCYLVNKFLCWEDRKLGQHTNRDRTTVMHSVQTITDFLQIGDTAVCAILNPIIKYLNSINEPIEI